MRRLAAWWQERHRDHVADALERAYWWNQGAKYERRQISRTLRTAEQHELAGVFADMLATATAEGAARREAGTKVYWKVDRHLPAAERHWSKYHAGARYDETGVHHLVKVAWRCLTTAYQEMNEDGFVPDSPELVTPHPRHGYGPIEAGAEH